jgi:hypothetical protein
MEEWKRGIRGLPEDGLDPVIQAYYQRPGLPVSTNTDFKNLQRIKINSFTLCIELEAITSSTVTAPLMYGISSLHTTQPLPPFLLRLSFVMFAQ